MHIQHYRAWLFGAFIFLAGCKDNSDNLALGTLERDRLVFKATASEVITQLPIPEGSDVNSGDVLVQLDTSRQLAVLAKAEAELASNKASLQKIQQGARTEDIAAGRAQVSGAEAQLLEAQKGFERATSLVTKKLLGMADLDTARAKRDSAEAAHQQAQESLLILTNGSRSEDILQAEAQVALAQAQVRIEQQNLLELSITASRAGKLDQLPKYLGERTQVGETVAVVLNNTAPYARVYVPETQRVNLQAGQTLLIHIDGLAAPFEGTLRWISQDPAFTPYFALNSSDRSRLMYIAKIDLPADQNNLPSGLPVQVELPVQPQ